MQKSVALAGGKHPFGPVVWMVTISGFAANFAPLSEKPLSFCTDFAHYHPIIMMLEADGACNSRDGPAV
jgi:hypothetical protein